MMPTAALTLTLVGALLTCTASAPAVGRLLRRGRRS